jgi:hypothetical protein
MPCDNSIVQDVNKPAVTDEQPVELEKWPVEVQNCRSITHHFRGIYKRIYPTLVKEKPEDVNM